MDTKIKKKNINKHPVFELMASFSDFQLLKQVTYQLNHIWILIKTKLK